MILVVGSVAAFVHAALIWIYPQIGDCCPIRHLASSESDVTLDLSEAEQSLILRTPSRCIGAAHKHHVELCGGIGFPPDETRLIRKRAWWNAEANSSLALVCSVLATLRIIDGSPGGNHPWRFEYLT